MFRSTAEGETGHAHGHLEFLEAVGDPATGLPIGDTAKNLGAAVAGETHEYTDMYPGFARTILTGANAYWRSLGALRIRVSCRLAAKRIMGVPEADQERTRADGKASSVQFVHFPFTSVQIAAFRQPSAEVMVGFVHKAYGHMELLPDPVQAELSNDFD